MCDSSSYVVQTLLTIQYIEFEYNTNFVENREDITLPDELIKQVNKLDKYLHNDIVATKEAAIDSEGFRLLSAIGREQVESAHGNLIQFDNITFMEKLVTYMGGRRGHGSASRGDVTLDWSKLGDRASLVFNRPPPTNFVYVQYAT